MLKYKKNSGDQDDLDTFAPNERCSQPTGADQPPAGLKVNHSLVRRAAPLCISSQPENTVSLSILKSTFEGCIVAQLGIEKARKT